MGDHDPQTPRAGRVRMAAAVLFFSGALIGGTLGRVSVWLLPGQVAPPPPAGQISRALEPPDVGGAQAADKAAATPEEKVRAEGRLPVAAAPSASSENAAREPGGTESPSVAPSGPATNESEPDAVATSQRPPPPTPSVKLLNPGAVQAETANERPSRGTRATRDPAAARDEAGPRRRRDRRAASSDDDVGATGRERGSRRDYRSLREEMLRDDR